MKEPPPSSSSSSSAIAKHLEALLHSAQQVQIFKTKWSLISTKLTTLHSSLSDLSLLPETPLSAELLCSLSETVSSADFLASLCHSPTPPAGKLKTQNDVDSISAKLEAHIHDLEILSTPENPQNDAFLVPAPNSVRAEARNLMTRLQIGSSESRSSVLDLVLGLLQEDDKNVLIVLSQGIVPVLVRLLDSSTSYEIKEKAVTVIAKISGEGSSKSVLLGEGLVLLNNLLRVLESGSVFAKEKTCIALGVLSDCKENARAISCRGGIGNLLEICQQGTPNSQALAAGVLRNLAFFEEVKESFVEENAVGVLLGLCNSGTALAQENSIGCLCNLVSGDDGLKLVFAREGGVDCVKNFWDSAMTNESLVVVVEMVRTLALCPNIAEFLVGDGFLNRIVVALSSGVLGVRVAAALAVYDLAYNTKTRKELGETDCIPFLVKMLDGKAIKEKEAAVKALSMLMQYDGNRKIFRKEDKGIASAVQLLDILPQESDMKHLISLLGSLLQSKKCRRQIVEAGAGVYLQKLVESDVDGAKKLFDSLGHGKLWRVFGRP